jgi:hypothetical protein
VAAYATRDTTTLHILLILISYLLDPSFHCYVTLLSIYPPVIDRWTLDGADASTTAAAGSGAAADVLQVAAQVLCGSKVRDTPTTRA